jgi:hypothetical protein
MPHTVTTFTAQFCRTVQLTTIGQEYWRLIKLERSSCSLA